LSADDDSELARLLPGVKRLQSDRVNPYRERPAGKRTSVTLRQTTPVIQPTDNIGTGSADHSHFNTGLQTKLQRKIRQGAIRPQALLDLHGYRQADALAVLQEFLEDALQRRYRMVLIIHGQGFRSQTEAILKPLVQRWLAAQPLVLAWCPAQARDGAAGASYVYLGTG
jgi:DNA-nicking Smr family endonuclease